jgi:serine protease Do
MGKSSISGWLVAIVMLGVLVGILGGGLTGGIAGYYAVLNRAQANLPSATSELVAAQSSNTPQTTTTMSVSEDSAVIEAVKKTEPGVVTIVNTLQSRSGRGFRPFGPGSGSNIAEGSGVIIDQQGHIVTNAHVVQGASQLDVIFSDGTETGATLLGADAANDIAVLQVSGNVPGVVPFGDSSALQLGETVIAIGSPLGSYRGSVTVGVVSGLDRSVQDSGQSGLIQTDAAINHGNSGGPLLNLTGQIIGINTLVVQTSDSGEITERLGFAIPSNTVSSVVNRIIGRGTSP